MQQGPSQSTTKYSSLGTHRVSIRFLTRFQVGRFRGGSGWDPPLELRTTAGRPRDQPAPGRRGQKPGVSQLLRGMLSRGATRRPGQTYGGSHLQGRRCCHLLNPAPAASVQPGHPSSCSQCMSAVEHAPILPQAAPIPRAPAVAGRRTVTRPCTFYRVSILLPSSRPPGRDARRTLRRKRCRSASP